MSRKQPTLTQKLDAALLTLLAAQGRPVPLDEAKAMEDGAVASLFQFDHDPIAHAHGGPNSGWNLTPRLCDEHREKTAKIDVPRIAKGKRISKEQEAFRARMLAKITGTDAEGLEKAQRRSRLRSAGFDKTRTRTMNGKVVPR